MNAAVVQCQAAWFDITVKGNRLRIAVQGTGRETEFSTSLDADGQMRARFVFLADIKGQRIFELAGWQGPGDEGWLTTDGLRRLTGPWPGQDLQWMQPFASLFRTVPQPETASEPERAASRIRRLIYRWWYRALAVVCAVIALAMAALNVAAGPTAWFQGGLSVFNIAMLMICASFLRHNQLEFGPDPWSDDEDGA